MANFGSIRSLVFLLVAPASVVWPAPITIEVPFVWQLNTTGDTFASVFVDNTGPIAHSESDSDTLAGNFAISTMHTPPGAGWIRIDPLPTQITLNVVAAWEGTLANSTLALDPFGLTIDTFVRSTAVVSAPGGFPAFTPATEEIGSATTKDINQQKNLAIATGVGTIPFSGSVDMQTLFGFGSGTLGDFATGAASLEISGALVAPTSVDITYEFVPEPGSVSLMSLGVLSLILGRVRQRINRHPKKIRNASGSVI